MFIVHAFPYGTILYCTESGLNEHMKTYCCVYTVHNTTRFHMRQYAKTERFEYSGHLCTFCTRVRSSLCGSAYMLTHVFYSCR